MKSYYLSVRLCSDATFGRGEGLAGLVDVEIEHDQYGFPFIGGRALKGLLQEEWQNLRFALGERNTRWQAAANKLFGTPGAMLDTQTDAAPGNAATMFVGAATLPPDLIDAVREQNLKPDDVLVSLTTIRRQTAINAESGAPERGSLRAFRVLLRETPMVAPLDFEAEPSADTLTLLAACVLAVRRGGSVRNRGRGRMALLLHDRLPDDYNDTTFTKGQFERFASEVK